MLTEKEKIETLTHLVIELNQVRDLDILMEHILTQARRFVNADAGSIYIAENGTLKFTYTQNDTLQKRLSKGEKLIYSTFSLPINEQSIAGYVAATGGPRQACDANGLFGSACTGGVGQQLHVLGNMLHHVVGGGIEIHPAKGHGDDSRPRRRGNIRYHVVGRILAGADEQA